VSTIKIFIIKPREERMCRRTGVC